MNCREALKLISAERAAGLEAASRSRLEAHLAECATCRRSRANLTAALDTWRAEVAAVKVPDAQREWLAVRRRWRGATDGDSVGARVPRHFSLLWFALPLAAAALAVAFFLPRNSDPTPGGPLAPAVARVDAVEVPGGTASTMVFVDDKSGWLIVWATDASQSE